VAKTDIPGYRTGCCRYLLAERHAEARVPDPDHWNASMLLRWVLTRDSGAVLSMVDHYGGWLVEDDNVTRIRPQTWDDVLRDFCIDDSLPQEEKAREAVVKAELFLIPAQEEIRSSLRRGDIEGWARPNGSGDLLKIESIQWAGLRFRSHDGHDIAVPVLTARKTRCPCRGHSPTTCPVRYRRPAGRRCGPTRCSLLSKP
jgi:hypothetical protein